jgi:hypothetical protein
MKARILSQPCWFVIGSVAWRRWTSKFRFEISDLKSEIEI